MRPDSPKDSDTPAFIRRQYEFAAHIRDPERQPRPGDVEDRRMAVYRELFFHNISGFIESGFPVLHGLLSNEAWTALVRDFMAEHRARTPYFREIAGEFVTYVSEAREPRPEEPPFLAELAHYEWVELALATSEHEIDAVEHDRDADLLTGSPVLSPLAWLLEYRFPVHHIRPDHQPQAPAEQPTYLVVYRNREDEIGFMEVNPVTARLIQVLGDRPGVSGRHALEDIATEIGHPRVEDVVEGGRQALEQLRERDIVLGATRA